MKFCKFKEYIKGIANSISYLSDAPFTTLKFPNESWFSDTKTEFEEELFGNINNTKDIDTLYCFYEKIIEKQAYAIGHYITTQIFLKNVLKTNCLKSMN